MKYWNVSRIKAFKLCGEYARNRYLLNIEPIGGEQKPEAHYGHSIHSGLAELQRTKDLHRALDAFRRDMAAFPEIEDMLAQGERTIEKYVELYGEKEKSILHAVEQEMEAPLTGLNAAVLGEPRILVGRLDAVVELDSPRGYWHKQIKTVGYNQDLARYASGYDLDWHESAYKMLWDYAHPDKKLNGTWLDLIRKQKRGAKAPGPLLFQRVFIPCSDKRVERFRADILAEIERWEAGVFTMNPTQCVHMYGRECPYRGKCVGFPFIAQDWATRESDYVDALNAGLTPVQWTEEEGGDVSQ